MKLYYFTMVLDRRDIALEDDRKLFGILRDESSYITEHLLRELNKEFSFDCRRINIFCKDEMSVRPGILQMDGIIDIDTPFDLSYFDMSDKEKEQYIFETVFDTLKRLCEFKGWDFAIFEKHLNELKANNFNVEFYLDDDVKRCRNGDYVARLFGKQEMHVMQIFVEFYRKRTFIERKLLATTNETRSIRYYYAFNYMKWIDEKTVAVYDYPEENVHFASMND